MSLVVKNPNEDIPLLSSDRLKKLFVDRCELTIDHVKLLTNALAKREEALKALYLFRSRLDTECVKQLAEGLVHTNAVDNVFLCSNPMHNDAVCGISAALASNARLEVLHLWDNEINDEQATILAEGLRMNKTLKAIHCPRNLITSNGATALMDAASHHPTLTTLNLSFNRISQNGGVGCDRSPLFQSLSTLCLETLSMDGNLLRNAGAEQVALALSANPELHNLHLSRAGINQEGCRSLAKGLISNTNLMRLVLVRNEVGHGNGLEQALEYNHTIQEILVDNRYRCFEIDFPLEWNRAGRRIVSESNLSWSVWPLVLARVTERPDLLFSFLSNKPELLSASSSSDNNNNEDVQC